VPAAPAARPPTNARRDTFRAPRGFAPIELSLIAASSPESRSISDGSLKWKFTTGGYLSSSPAIGPDGTIYIGSSAEALPMPGDDRLGLDDSDRVENRRAESVRPHEQQSVLVRQSHSLGCPFVAQHDDLLTEDEILRRKLSWQPDKQPESTQ
jgi:putative pyrroloquinoline-quinone-binding quinoprotein